MTGEASLGELLNLASSQDGVVTGTQAAALGIPRRVVRRKLRSGAWRLLSRGSYWVVPDGQPRFRSRVRAAMLTCGLHAVAVGPTAAQLHGIGGAPTDARVHLATPTPGKQRPGTRLHRLNDRAVMSLRGLPITTPAQTVADLLLTLGRIPAISVLDSALHQGVLPQGLASLQPLLVGRKGVTRARLWLPQADRRAESPLETRLRLICTDAGMPPETLQWILDDPLTGRRCRIDAGWPSRWVGVEADGRTIHGRPDALYADRHRQNALTAAHPRLVLLRFTWEDASFPEEFLTRLRQALSAT